MTKNGISASVLKVLFYLVVSANVIIQSGHPHHYVLPHFHKSARSNYNTMHTLFHT